MDIFPNLIVYAKRLTRQSADGFFIAVPRSHWNRLKKESDASKHIFALIGNPQLLPDHVGFEPDASDGPDAGFEKVKFLHVNSFDIMGYDISTNGQTYTLLIGDKEIKMVTNTAGLTFHPGTHALDDGTLEKKRLKKEGKAADKKRKKAEKQQMQKDAMDAFWNGE